MVRVQSSLDKLESTAITLFYYILRVLLSGAIGFLAAKCAFVDNFSPFSIILLTVSQRIGLIPTICFLSSALGHLTTPLDLSVFKYITALTMIYIVYMVFQKSTHIVKNDTAILSTLSCFIAGFLFLLAEGLNLFSVLLLLCESVLVCCCIYFINYAVKAFRKSCYLSPRELIAATVTLILILLALQNITFFGMNITRVLSIIILFLALSCLKTSHSAVLGCCLAIILAAVENGGESIFTAMIVGTLTGCVFSNFSDRLAMTSFVIAYYAVLFFFGKFPWSYWLFSEPPVAMAFVFFIPKQPLRMFLSSYIIVKSTDKKHTINEKDIMSGCFLNCQSICPKSIICYEKNKPAIRDAIDQLSSQQNETVDNESLLPFCIKPSAMIECIQKQIAVHDGERFESLIDQLNHLTQKIELKLESELKPLRFFSDEEEEICRELKKHNITVRDISLIEDEKQNKKCDISFNINQEIAHEKIIHDILRPYFNDAISVKITENGGNYWAHIKEKSTYRISCAALSKNKKGEQVCGDSALGFSLNKDTYCILLADGMGSGKEAGYKSKLAINTLYKLLNGGLSPQNALNIFRATERLQEDNHFTTIDICLVDLNAGSVDFYKAGAFDSFLIRRDKLSTLRGGGMPLGVSEQDRVKHLSVRITDGDYLIMGSDGLSGFDFQLESTLLLCKDSNVRNYAQKILRSLSEKNGADNRDDITVIVSKIQKNAE